MTPSSSNRLNTALRRFDEENAKDPNFEVVEGQRLPRELVYSDWLTTWVLRLCPDASEELRLAARGQHICRWMSPRKSHPSTRAGYLRWRESLKRFHAEKAGQIMKEAGYEDETIVRVRNLILKKNFPDDVESRVLEDALCLVFLEKQLEALAAKLSDDKMVAALKKAWDKMTPAAQERALALPYRNRERKLLEKALF
jgi:hypothetical protein